MIRTALQPRLLALLAAVVLVVVGFGRLGMWQLDVSRDTAAKDALAHQQAQPAAPLHQVLTPHAAFRGVMSNRKVLVTGRYDASGQFLVPDRLLEGRRGYWVVTPLDEAGTRARVAVVRGFVTSPADTPAPPTAQVMVRGTLAPGESPSTAGTLPAGQRGSIDLAELVNHWPQELYNGFVVAQGEQPDTAPAALRRIPPPQPESSFNLRNAAYAVQWWIFAAFAVYLWWRTVRDTHREARRAPSGIPDPDPAQPTDLPGDAS
ncbi:SURF1 family protein [Arsenicicoccus dermatophilus]|uniref:SURF1 family protein n=1 Tax=Arsenicicoccus dermatophilus TaxID=1076331 RepID=UPI0039170E53